MTRERRLERRGSAQMWLAVGGWLSRSNALSGRLTGGKRVSRTPPHHNGTIGRRHPADLGPFFDMPPFGRIAAAAVLALNRRAPRDGPANPSWRRKRMHDAVDPPGDSDKPHDEDDEDSEPAQVVDHLPFLTRRTAVLQVRNRPLYIRFHPRVRRHRFPCSIGCALVASPALQGGPIKGGLDAGDCGPCARWPLGRAKCEHGHHQHRGVGEEKGKGRRAVQRHGSNLTLRRTDPASINPRGPHASKMSISHHRLWAAV